MKLQNQSTIFIIIINLLFFVFGAKFRGLSTIEAICFKMEANATISSKDPCRYDCVKGEIKLSANNVVPNMEACEVSKHRNAPKVCYKDICVYEENVFLCGNPITREGVLDEVIEMECYLMCLTRGINGHPSETKYISKKNGLSCRVRDPNVNGTSVPGKCQNGVCEAIPGGKSLSINGRKTSWSNFFASHRLPKEKDGEQEAKYLVLHNPSTKTTGSQKYNFLAMHRISDEDDEQSSGFNKSLVMQTPSTTTTGSQKYNFLAMHRISDEDDEEPSGFNKSLVLQSPSTKLNNSQVSDSDEDGEESSADSDDDQWQSPHYSEHEASDWQGWPDYQQVSNSDEDGEESSADSDGDQWQSPHYSEHEASDWQGWLDYQQEWYDRQVQHGWPDSGDEHELYGWQGHPV